MKISSKLLARQPICNKRLKTVAFELLYRNDSDDNHAHVSNNDAATIDVLLSAFNDLAIEDIVGDKLAFVNFTSNILQNQLPPFSNKQLVIELLEGQDVTDELIKTLSRLRKAGYKIALDDFSLNKETIALIDHADIIKLDVLTDPPQTWADYIPKLKDRGIKLLAEKVETHEVFTECCELGFDLFQGYFFAKPQIIKGKRTTNNELTILNLLQKINSSDIDINDVTEHISMDAKLSYNLLRTINSGLFSLPIKVESIKHAITMLGLKQLKTWINFLALSSLDNKPQALAELALIRAKMCEQLGKLVTNKPDADDYFTLGLFSLIDAFFDQPKEELISKLAITDAMKSALLDQSGEMGMILKTVINYQEGNWVEYEKNKVGSDSLNTNEALSEAHINSIKWLGEHLSS